MSSGFISLTSFPPHFIVWPCLLVSVGGTDLIEEILDLNIMLQDSLTHVNKSSDQSA